SRGPPLKADATANDSNTIRSAIIAGSVSHLQHAQPADRLTPELAGPIVRDRAMTRSVDETKRGFDALGLIPPLVEAIATLGYEEPTPIKPEAIPGRTKGRESWAQAPPGPGRTAALPCPRTRRSSEETSGAVGPGARTLS